MGELLLGFTVSEGKFFFFSKAMGDFNSGGDHRPLPHSSLYPLSPFPPLPQNCL